jgi:ferredoxin-NADP reductase/MOSC domain-containing protein YiiM
MNSRSTSTADPAGRLLSVNVGMPQDVPWRDRTVHTGVWKQPVQGPTMVRSLNLDGDGQGDLGGHGGPHRAVLVYQLASYRHWQTELGREGFEYGQFGENFTVDGLPDHEVCIGDRYEIGGALFEVSQPRVTCYRVGLRMAEPRLAALMVAHRRPGFYLRVLREGLVEAGDPIVRVAEGPERMTVAEADGLLYLPGHDRAAVVRALRIPALSPGWQGSFRALRDAPPGARGNVGLSDEGTAPPAWPGFRSMRVAQVVHETASVKSVRLLAADDRPVPAGLPGQFVTLRFALGDGQPVTSRSYSLSGPPATPGYRVSVKREPHGLVSRFVHATLRIGSLVDVAAPRGRFTLDAAQDADPLPVLLVSAGIGVTPVLAMLHALASEGSRRRVWWLHGARNSSEQAFAAEARSLLARLPDAEARICFSAPLPADRAGRDYSHHGRLSAEFIAGLPLPADAHAFVCGPQQFMTDVRAALIRGGIDAARVHTEVFGAGPAVTPGIVAAPAIPPHPPAGPVGNGPAVTFSRSGLTVRWRDDFASLLELAEAGDVPARWSCRTGVCHTCEAGLLAGGVRYDPPPIDEPAEGNVLICCSTPDEDVVLDL